MPSLKQSEAERRQAEEKLRLQLDFTKTITNSLGEGVYALDREGRLTFMNPAAEQMLGWKEAEMLGKNVHDCIHFQRADGTRVSAEECELLAVMHSNVTIENDDDAFTRRDGVIFPVSYTSSPIVTGGQVVGAVLTFRDITERKRAGEALRKSEEQYRFLAEAIPQQVWTAQADGALDFVNQRVLDYFDCTMEEMIGAGWQSGLHPEDVAGCLERWRNSLATGATYSVEFRLRRASDETYRWHLGRALPVRDQQGQIIKWFGTNTDIEEQKLMEEALALVNRKREQMLEEVSTPVVPVWRGVLVLPIIGTLDTERMQRATEAALGEVVRTGAHACIIDITAARLVDSHAVANLGSLVASLKLIGAEAIVTGVTAQAARSLVNLGVDFTGMRTRRTLAEALATLIKSPKQTTKGRKTRTGFLKNGTTR